MCVYVSVSVFLCMRSGPVNQTCLKWELNANSSKMVKATDFDKRVFRDSPDMTPWNFSKRGHGQGNETPLIFGR